jgi:hypothetical protein
MFVIVVPVAAAAVAVVVDQYDDSVGNVTLR